MVGHAAHLSNQREEEERKPGNSRPAWATLDYGLKEKNFKRKENSKRSLTHSLPHSLGNHYPLPFSSPSAHRMELEAAVIRALSCLLAV